MEQTTTKQNIANQDVMKPRITPSLFPNFVNHEVTFVGTVLEIQANQVLLSTSDSSPQVTAYLNDVSDLTVGDAIEFYGVVQDEKTIRERYQTHYTLFAPEDRAKQIDFDFDTYEKTVALMHSPKYSFIFSK